MSVKRKKKKVLIQTTIKHRQYRDYMLFDTMNDKKKTMRYMILIHMHVIF